MQMYDFGQTRRSVTELIDSAAVLTAPSPHVALLLHRAWAAYALPLPIDRRRQRWLGLYNAPVLQRLGGMAVDLVPRPALPLDVVSPG
eukprot:10279153-Alexandrium_andersonii.AAC.1